MRGAARSGVGAMAASAVRGAPRLERHGKARDKGVEADGRRDGGRSAEGEARERCPRPHEFGLGPDGHRHGEALDHGRDDDLADPESRASQGGGGQVGEHVMARPAKGL